MTFVPRALVIALLLLVAALAAAWFLTRSRRRRWRERRRIKREIINRHRAEQETVAGTERKSVVDSLSTSLPGHSPDHSSLVRRSSSWVEIRRLGAWPGRGCRWGSAGQAWSMAHRAVSCSGLVRSTSPAPGSTKINLSASVRFERRVAHGPDDAWVVGWPGGVSPPGSHRSVREPLDSYGSCHPDHHQAEGTHFQCANRRGYLSVISRSLAWAFFAPCSRLYFLRIHRTR